MRRALAPSVWLLTYTAALADATSSEAPPGSVATGVPPGTGAIIALALSLVVIIRQRRRQQAESSQDAI